MGRIQFKLQLNSGVKGQRWTRAGEEAGVACSSSAGCARAAETRRRGAGMRRERSARDSRREHRLLLPRMTMRLGSARAMTRSRRGASLSTPQVACALDVNTGPRHCACSPCISKCARRAAAGRCLGVTPPTRSPGLTSRRRHVSGGCRLGLRDERQGAPLSAARRRRARGARSRIVLRVPD